MSATIVPALRYRDADAGVEFLRSAFGAEEKEIHRDEHGIIRHAELRLSGGLVMVGPGGRAGLAGRRAGAPAGLDGQPLRGRGEPDAHHERAVAAGAKLVRPLEDTGYGSREYSVRDPEGNLWSFGTYDPSGAG
jgi:uncharacterized glyoxalase superfamily protein PhnB